ncbi:MAG: hypothetical protein QXO95_03955 [Candidatus Aenigmatarchaeota archaeon]
MLEEKRLGEILTSSQIKELKLRELFNKWRKELLLKEVEPDYISFCL